MESETSRAQRSRQTIARIMKAAIIICWCLMAGGVAVVARQGHPSPSALAVAGGIGCLAGAFAMGFRGLGRWVHDPQIALTGKEAVFFFGALAVGAILLLTFGSASL